MYDVRAGADTGDVLRAATARLQVVTDTPRLEAELLLASLMERPRTALLAHPEWPVSSAEVETFRMWVERRAAGCPLPYLTGQACFYGLVFDITPDVLIPRPETETLIDLALLRNPRTVVDVGTGSGCVAVALAHHLPTARIYAIDVSGRALRVAAANARRHAVAGRVRLVQGDLMRPLGTRVDLVVSNPPYVSSDEWPSLPQSVRQYEPRIALDGGADGLAVVRRLLASAGRIVRPGGALLVEIGARQGEEAESAARSTLPKARVTVHRDLAGRDRVLEVEF
jgi:release factor glutamine methyltransferase